jgi:acyl-CoA reductase-like NAD-dependent aldehyde dehydrogenase
MAVAEKSVVTHGEWEQRAANIQPRTQAFIDGTFVDAQSGATFDDIGPRDGKLIARVAAGDKADIDLAVAAARKAFERGVWAQKSPRERKRVLKRFADLMRNDVENLALLETLDVGKPIRDSLRVDVPNAAFCFEWYAEAIDKLYDEIAPTSSRALALVTREPIGVVGVVVPWNYPLIITAWKVAPALAAGNSVVLKPAEQSPLSALRLAELAQEAGVPDGVFNVVPGLGETAGAALGLHMDVDKIAFTGSTEVGRYFLRYAADSNVKSVSLELGGKSPQLVLADAPDLQAAAVAVASGIFYNQGETCNAGSRLLVDRRIHDEFVEAVVAASATMQPNDPLDPRTSMGALIDRGHLDRVLGYVSSGKDEGAVVRTGGEQVRLDSGGYFLPPTVFERVENSMRIAREEIFGPVLSVFDFDSLDEAIKLANDTPYGLAASVWTSDLKTAHNVSRALRAGTVWVNCFDYSEVTTPFGGFKQSGSGRDRSLHAFEQYTQLKTTWIDLN